MKKMVLDAYVEEIIWWTGHHHHCQMLWTRWWECEPNYESDEDYLLEDTADNCFQLLRDNLTLMDYAMYEENVKTANDAFSVSNEGSVDITEEESDSSDESFVCLPTSGRALEMTRELCLFAFSHNLLLRWNALTRLRRRQLLEAT